MSEEIALDAVGQRYQLNGEVGRGGMSVVYQAIDPRIGRKVAVKLLHPHLATREDARRRFLQEAQAIALLENSNILKVYDYDSPDGAASYIVSEFIEGVTLKTWVERFAIKHWEVAALFAIPLFRALAHAHDHGIIHRDVKPENMMIRDRDGSPVLMDFGIAHMVDSETLTATGAVIGSPAHMAPEVVNGEKLRPQADLFSMGTVLYWMVCGSLPFVAPNPAALFRRILEARFDPIQSRRPEVISPFTSIVERCMSRDPSDRAEGASQVADEIEDLLAKLELDDIEAELNSLSASPSQYQAQLSTRLPKRYCVWAREAIQESSFELSLELAERALILDPTCTEAEKILREAQRSIERRGSRHKLLLSIAILPLFAGLVFASNTLTQSDLDSANRSTQLTEPASGVKRQVSSKTIAPQARNSLEQAQERTPSGGRKDQSEAERSSLSKASPSKSQKAQKQVLKSQPRDSKKLRRRRVAQSLTSKRDESSPKKKAIGERSKTKKKGEVRLVKQSKGVRLRQHRNGFQRIDISSLYKGVLVSVDGRAVGHIYEIERAGGLELSLGNAHEITFSSPFCKRHREVVRYRKVQSRAPRLVFECTFKPATFQIKSKINADIFLNGDQPRRLGMTNQKLTFPLQSTEATLDLLIMRGDGQGEPFSLRVAAGQYKEKSW